ncbi:MAG: ABC transporter substrate-binding protein, partial [Anaerolineales bacterium]|nr:ABC transporter substrate-binding protein [Anaerolineales bacterium]MDW8447115.1 ABC transporter substrate-binding protein [Anaerolineales bacterium]
MKKLFVLIAILVMAGILLVGCGGTAATPTQAALKFAVYAINSEPLTSWDPAIEYSNGIHVHNNMYEQLLRYDAIEKKIVPLLAESYEVSADGQTWTFKLRQGVKFQNGDPFTAEDVKFSIERTKQLGAGASYIWSAVEAINVLDPQTVEFKLSYKAPLDLIASTGYAAFIYSRKCVKEDNTWIEEAKGCGTGPYMLKSAKWGEEVILEKFAEYWGGWQENSFDTVVFRKVAEPATRRQVIETGEATITVELTYTDIEALKNNPKVKVYVEPSFQNLIAMFNTQKPPLDNVDLRRALSYAFPYEQVIKTAIGGYGRQSYGMVPYGMWGWSDQLPRYTYDLDRAREHLQKAGYGEGGLKLLLVYTAGNEAEKSAAELYKSELAKLNIDLEIRGMPWDSQWELAKGPAENRQDIFMMYWWPDMPSPYSMLYSTFHSEEEPLFNLSYYKNPRFDQLIDEANELTSTDRAKAEQMFIEAQRILLEDAVALFIYDRQDVWVTVANLQGFRFNPAYPTVVFFHQLTM